MTPKTHTIDRTGWGPGPWDTEPDRLEFRHGGMPCLLLRNGMGVWCGYVGLAPGHPWHGLQHDICPTPTDPTHANNEIDFEWHDCDLRPDGIIGVHGGLTYSGGCRGHICHVPEPGESENVWWFGFDCGHAFDLIPSFALKVPGFKRLMEDGSHYRDLAYATAETEALAEQLAEVPRLIQG